MSFTQYTIFYAALLSCALGMVHKGEGESSYTYLGKSVSKSIFDEKCYNIFALQKNIAKNTDLDQNIARLAQDTELVAKAFFQKDVKALKGIGRMYAYTGNKKEAERWFRYAEKSIQINTKHKSDDLGFIQQRQHVEKAIRSGNIVDIIDWDFVYPEDEGKERKVEKAFSVYAEAAEQGDPHAQFTVGILYYFGQGCDKNFTKALLWFEKSAKQQHDFAECIIAAMYDKGEGYTQDFEKAFSLYTKLADRGLEAAQYNLAGMYSRGEGCKKNLTLAMYWYTKVAEQGGDDAQNALADMYYYGKGCEKDFDKAFFWYTKAAEQGDREAQNALGQMYAKGEGCKRDLYLASFWLEKAANQGNAAAQHFLDTLKKEK